MSVPPPVPSLPDTDRITTYAAVVSLGPFAVGFDIYGDGSDPTAWISVTLNGVDQAPNWTLSSPSGSVSLLPRPITDAVITFPTAVTGALVITGARRPRRAQQISENQGEPARSKNQTYNDLMAALREAFDLRDRTVLARAGETIANLPALAQRAGNPAVWGLDGSLTYLAGGAPLGVPGFLGLKATYGAKGDGVTNDTAALLAADAVGGYCFVEPGTYVIDTVVLTKLKGLIGLGGPTFVPSANVPTGATQAFFILFSGSGCNDCIVSGIQVSATKATYPNLFLLCATGTSDMHIVDNVTAGGRSGIYAANCFHHYVVRNHVSVFSDRGIECDGASQFNINVLDNHVDGFGSSTGCITFQLGALVTVTGNYVAFGGFFGIGALTVNRVYIRNNSCFNSAHEGINLEDCSEFDVSHNEVTWDIGVSVDLGITIFGNAGLSQFGVIEGNVIINAGFAGICLTTKTSYCRVSDNLVLDCARNGTDPGILLTGSACAHNTVENNSVFDVIGGLHTYGVAEIDRGAGLPALNIIRNNAIEGWLTSPILHVNTLVPTALGGNTDNWAPSNLHYYEYVNISASGAVNLTGMTDGYSGSRKVLRNSGANTITLKDNVTSAAGNRFFLGADFPLLANKTIALEWQSGANGWVPT